jgi:hypothetical protein
MVKISKRRVECVLSLAQHPPEAPAIDGFCADPHEQAHAVGRHANVGHGLTRVCSRVGLGPRVVQ